MKNPLLMILVVIIGFPLSGQEVQFPSAILPAGGSSWEGAPVILSRWRMGQVHVITLPQDKSHRNMEDAFPDWNVSVYPNPVGNNLYLEFELPESREFILKITDVAGRVVFVQEARQFIDGSIVELNISGYIPALYVLQVFPPDLQSRQVHRIQKL